MSVVFKKVGKTFLPIIQGLDLICFEDEGYQLGDSALSRCDWWIGYDNKSPVCYAGLYIHPHGAFLERAGVLPSHRGQGLQKRLIALRRS